MQRILKKIKRLIISGQYVFTLKAESEMFVDNFTETDILESILNANGIKKIIKSTSPYSKKHERLYVIESFTYDGVLIYTKGTIKRDETEQETFYLLISSKKSTVL